MSLRTPFFAAALLLSLAAFGSADDAARDKKDNDKEKFTVSKEEQRIVDVTNEARAKHKLPPLKVNPLLFACARGHSANQARQQKGAHVLDGKGPDDRTDAAGYDFKVCSENIRAIRMLDYKQIIEGWMGSPDHRKNILDNEFEDIGVGIALDPKGGFYYITQVFATPQK